MCSTSASTVRAPEVDSPAGFGRPNFGEAMNNYATGGMGAREDLSRYLAACYYEPSTDFGEEHLFDSIQAASMAIDPDLGESARMLGEAFAAQDMQSLLIDYTALFIGPAQPRAMPYASFWLTRDPSMRHEATMSVLDFYGQGGFDVSEELHELPDHVAVELEFLYLMTYRLNQPQADDDQEDLRATGALRRRFVIEHLGSWIGPFAAAVDVGACTAFYKELARFTERFVHLEAGLNSSS